MNIEFLSIIVLLVCLCANCLFIFFQFDNWRTGKKLRHLMVEEMESWRQSAYPSDSASD